MSLICSLTDTSPRAKTRSKLRILTCKNGSVMPCTSCSGAYPDAERPLSNFTRLGTMGRNMSLMPFSSSSASSASHTLMTKFKPHSRTPWFLSWRSCFAFSKKCSCKSGTLRHIRMAQRAAFRRMYGFALDSIVSTSGKRSRAISTEAMFPRVQRARPTIYWLGWFRSLASVSRCACSESEKHTS